MRGWLRRSGHQPRERTLMGGFTPQQGCPTPLWVRLQPGGSVPGARPAALTRMLGSSRECRARMMASSETRVSPLVWISSTAIWGRRSAAISARGQALGQPLRASQRDIPWQGGSCGAPHRGTQPGQTSLRLWPQLCPEGPDLLGPPAAASLPSRPVSCLPQRSRLLTGSCQGRHWRLLPEHRAAGGTMQTAPAAPQSACTPSWSSTVCPCPLCPPFPGLSQPEEEEEAPADGREAPAKHRRGELSLLLHPGQGGHGSRECSAEPSRGVSITARDPHRSQ